MPSFTIYHKTRPEEVIDEVNTLLKQHGLEFQFDGLEHDGFEIVSLVEVNVNSLGKTEIFSGGEKIGAQG